MKQQPVQLDYARPIPKEPPRDERYAAHGWLLWLSAFILSFGACSNSSNLLFGVAVGTLVLSFMCYMREMMFGTRQTLVTYLLLPANILVGLEMFVVHSFLNGGWCCN
jgi:hypothetical protein